MIYRQGDVLLAKVAALPKGATKKAAKGDVILAYGEVTGHAHRIAAPQKVVLWDAGAERYLQVLEQSTLTHEEHATITLPSGIYRMPTQVEYSPRELRRVAD